MPFGAVFTTSDPGGGRPYTRLRGPLLMGYSTADPGGQTQTPTQVPAGSAAQPIYSFYPQPNMGLYGNVVTSSAGEIRLSVAAADLVQFTSQGIASILAGTPAAPTYAVSSSGVSGLYSSAAGIVGVTAASIGIVAASTVGLYLVSSSGYSAGGFYSTGATTPGILIPQTTGSLSGAAAPAVANSQAVIVWDNVNKRLWVYSAVTSWLGTSTSTGVLGYSSS